MSPSSSLQRTGRHVEPCARSARSRALRAATLVLAVVAVLGTGAGAAIAAEPLTPVKLGEEPIFERTTPFGDVTYVPGRGLHLGDTRLTIGGWASVSGHKIEGHGPEAEIDDISFFVIWDPTPRLHVFSEIEYSDALQIDEDGHVSDDENAVTADRLFADLRVNDLLTVRAGLFRTPVGRWNVIHAAPLVWTTEQPLTTELPFDPTLNGIMLFGSVFRSGGVLSYSLYDQYAPPLEGDPEFEPADHSAGARLEYTADAGWSVGGSYLAARREGDWRHVGGLDAWWGHGRFELMSELVIEAGEGGGTQGGGFLQGVVGLTDRLFLVGRFEHYTRPGSNAEIGTLGLAFRPVPAVVLKAEYLFSDTNDDEIEPGLHISISTLF